MRTNQIGMEKARYSESIRKYLEARLPQGALICSISKSAVYPFGEFGEHGDKG